MGSLTVAAPWDISGQIELEVFDVYLQCKIEGISTCSSKILSLLTAKHLLCRRGRKTL